MIATSSVIVSNNIDGIGIVNTIIEYSVSASGASVPGQPMTDGSGQYITDRNGLILTDGWASTIPTVNSGQWLWTRTRTIYTDGTFVLAYALSRNGVDGQNGQDGHDGGAPVTITQIVKQYRLSDSNTQMTGSGTGYSWSTTMPEVGANQYLWEREVIYLSDNSTPIETDAICNTVISDILFDVDSLNSQITSKVSQVDMQTAINELSGDVTTAISNASTTINQRIDGIDTTIGSMNTTLNSKADSSTVQTIESNLNQQIQTANSNISTITSTYAKLEDLDNIEIGTRNLVAESDEEKNIINGVITFNITTYGGAVIPGKDIVVSADIKSTVNNVKMGTYLQSSAPAIIGEREIIEGIGTSYKRFVVKCTIPSGSAPATIAFSCTSTDEANTNATYYVKNVKVETGTIVSDWSRAPEDVAEEISSTQSVVTQTADTIGWMINTNGTTASSFTLTSHMAELLGPALVIKDSDTSTSLANSRTVISGGRIATDLVKSNNYVAPVSPSVYSSAGSFFDLATGNIITPNFVVNGSNAYFRGNVEATSLTLGNNTTYSGTIPQAVVDGLSTALSSKADSSVLSNYLLASQVSVTDSTDANGVKTTTITYDGHQYTTITSEDGNYILTNLGVGTTTVGQDNKKHVVEGVDGFVVSTNGLLEASNAIIYGTVYATNGRFSGEVTATSGHIGSYSITSDGVLIGTNVLLGGGAEYYDDETGESYSGDSIAQTGINCGMGIMNNPPYYHDYAYWLATGTQFDEINLTEIDDVPWYVDFDGTMVAKKAIIGNPDKSHLIITQNSFQLFYGNDSSPYVDFIDLRDNLGIVHITEVFYGDGSNEFEVNHKIYYIVSVKVDNIKLSSSDYSVTDNYKVTLATVPSNDSEIIIYYDTQDKIRTYTLGERDDAENAGTYSFAVGESVVASGSNSYAQGLKTKATGDKSHSEGFSTTASGSCSHAEGCETTASGSYSHSEGFSTTASGSCSHAEGNDTKAIGKSSHAQNLGTTTLGQCQTAIGKYNIESSTHAFIIGNGTSENRSNALTVDWNGNLEAAGRVIAKTGASRISCDMATGLSGSTYLIYDTVTQTVRVYGVFAASSSQQASVALATIPSGYRPTSDTYIAGTVTNGSNVTACTAYTIRSDGTIKQNNTNAAMSGMFVGEYAI